MRFIRLGLTNVSAAFLLFACLLTFNAQSFAFSGSGAGTSVAPYKVTTCTELTELSLDLAAHYELDGEIDCNAVTFHPIGSLATPFTGSLDGNGYVIKNVTISEAASEVGIFGALDNATITDIRLENVDVAGQGNVGALAGHTYYATISYIAGTDITVIGSASYVGGLVGQLGGSNVSKSYVEAVNVTSSADTVGGLVGYAVGPTTVGDSYATGMVDAPTTVGGVIGQLGAGPAFADHLYADIVFVDAGSAVVGTVAFGASTSSTFIANGSYLSTNAVAPLDAWDFTNIWYVRPGFFPGLRPNTLPILLCDPSASNASSMTVSCTSSPLLYGDPQWELRYGFKSDTNRTLLASQAGFLFNVTVPGLLPGTDYELEFRYVDAIGTSPWGRVEVTTTGSSDVDNDGLSNEEEFKAPNNGDADNSGVLDYLEPNVTSIKSVINGKYVTLKTACTDNYNTMLGAESGTDKDVQYDHPAGLLGFVIRGCSVGATTPVTVYYYGTYNPADYIVRKRINNTYVTVPGAVLSAVSIGGQSALKVSYQITDGGAFDDDGIADGNIVDPVGIAPNISPTAPNTGILPYNNFAALFTVAGLICLVGSLKSTVSQKSTK